MQNCTKSVIIILLFLAALSKETNAQPQNNNSLKHSSTSTSEDSVKLSVLEKLAAKATVSNYASREESIAYYRQALELNIGLQKRAEILNRIGFYNWQLGNYDEAIVAYYEALEYFKELNDSTYLGRVYNNIATAKWGLGNNLDALEYYQKSLKIRKDIQDKKGVSTVLNNIGKLYQDLRLYEEAFPMHKEALSLSLEVNNVGAVAYSYASIGDCYEMTNELELALRNFKKGFDTLAKVDKRNRSNSYFSSRIGSIYLKTNKLDSALFYNKRALAYALRINNKNRIALAQHKLGNVFIAINENDSALFYLHKSYISSQEKGYSVLEKDNLFSLAKLEENNKNTEKAFALYKQASALNDSIYNQQVIEKITDTQIKYVNAQQKQENAILRKNNQIQEITIREQKRLTWFFISLIFCILVILFFINKNLSTNKKLNTKLKESEKKLMKANADKDKFFTIISHDLKSPFNGLLGITELLESNYESLETQEIKKMISLLQQSSANVNSLLDGLLQWARLQIGGIEYDYKSFDFSKKIENVTKPLETAAQQKQITIKNTVCPNTFVFADKKSTATVLRNLISNAIKFTNTGGIIEIQAVERETEYILSVCDNGVGMSKSKVDKLFSITKKESVPGTNKEQGTGLGLILCKEFIEKNNGRIWVDSELGKGSKFCFCLPKYLN